MPLEMCRMHLCKHGPTIKQLRSPRKCHQLKCAECSCAKNGQTMKEHEKAQVSFSKALTHEKATWNKMKVHHGAVAMVEVSCCLAFAFGNLRLSKQEDDAPLHPNVNLEKGCC